MSDTGLRRSPKFEKGALVQLLKDLVTVVPNVIPFQYNPEKLSHTLTPWDPFEVDQTQRGAQAPTVQPFDPKGVSTSLWRSTLRTIWRMTTKWRRRLVWPIGWRRLKN